MKFSFRVRSVYTLSCHRHWKILSSSEWPQQEIWTWPNEYFTREESLPMYLIFFFPKKNLFSNGHILLISYTGNTNNGFRLTGSEHCFAVDNWPRGWNTKYTFHICKLLSAFLRHRLSMSIGLDINRSFDCYPNAR